MIAVPGVGDRLPRISRNTTGKLKRSFSSKRFAAAEFVERGKVNGAAWRAIMLSSDNLSSDLY